MARVSVRTKIRQLPPERRRDVVAALHEGRAAHDPRDAPLVAAVAERPARFARRWPFRIWIQPQKGWERTERAVHLVVGVPALLWLIYQLWSNGGWWHWIVPAWLLLCATSIPTYRRTFRMLRNAPAALAANRDIAARDMPGA